MCNALSPAERATYKCDALGVPSLFDAVPLMPPRLTEATATVTTDNVTLSQSPSITFVTDTPSPSVSTFFVSPTTVLLGAPATATVTACAKISQMRRMESLMKAWDRHTRAVPRTRRPLAP